MTEKIEKYTQSPICPCCQAENSSLFLCNAGKDGKYTQYQCCKCGFQFTYPCPSSEEIDLFYASESYYQTTGEKADSGDYSDYDTQIECSLNFFRDLLKKINLPQGSTMLDVGCAKGRYMELARKEFGIKCTGVELSDYAREYIQEYYHETFPVWKSLDDIPVQKSSFNLIILFDVIEHVNCPWDILLKLFQKGCINEKTNILITTPNCAHEDAIKDPAAWEYRYPPAHLSFCSPETFQKIGEKLLFRNIDITGHSLMEGRVSIKNEIQPQMYSAFSGLICSFSGSSLGRISPERIPLSLEELNKSGDYLTLLSDFIFEKKVSPFNAEFGKYIASSYATLEKCMKLKIEAANRLRYHMWLEMKNLHSLADQACKFSEELDRVYRSDAYRIGRKLSWPANKYRSFVSKVKNKLQKCQILKKEYGTTFLLQRIFQKVFSKLILCPIRLLSIIITKPFKNRQKEVDSSLKVEKKSISGEIEDTSSAQYYDVISSIGSNCEISFNLNRVYGFVDSYPLIWSFVHSLKTLPEVIKNPMILSGEQPMKHDYSCNMVRYTNVDISFHCKNHAEALFGTDGTVDESKAQAERDELKSRLTYLSGKWKKVLEDPDQKVLCVLSPFEDQCTTEEILSVYEALQKYPAVDLLTILTGKEATVSATILQEKGIFVRYISKHPPHDKVTDENANDIEGWDKILREFRPRHTKISNKVYKYEH